MKARVYASIHTKASQRASASNSAADSRCVEEAVWLLLLNKLSLHAAEGVPRCDRAALLKVSWKQYQKHGLPETRVLSALPKLQSCTSH